MATVDPLVDRVFNTHVLTWPFALNRVFNDSTRDYISERNCRYDKEKVIGCFSNIKGGKDICEDADIEGNPQVFVSDQYQETF